MTYLNPALWLGLLLAAVPIILHLLARRRLRRQPFSTLDFLKRLQTKRMRNLRLRQWLLLLLRTLAVLLLAFAFLRPTLRGSGVMGGGRSESVVLFDLSASMVAKRPDGTPLERGREALKQIWASNGTLSLVAEDADGDRDVGRREGGGDMPAWIDRLAVDGRAQQLGPAWQRASERLKESGAPTRELLWVSDFTGTPPHTLPPLPQGVVVRRIDVGGSKPVANAWVKEVRLADAVVRSGETASLEVEGHLSGSPDPVKAIVTVTLDGRRVGEGEMELRPDSPTVQRFAVQIPATGYHSGEATLEITDALPSDNRFPFVLHVPGKRQVLIAGDDVRAIRYFELALDPDGSGKAYQVRVRPGNLRGVNLDSADVVILAGLGAPDPVTARRLAQFVEDGGGLWLLLGDQADLGAISRTVLANLGFGPVADEGGRARSEGRWGDLDRGHPALAGLLTGKGDFDAPVVHRLYTAQERKGDRALVRLGDGRPFLLERDVGRGRAWWTPAAANPSWTDWPVSGVFAPMVQQGVAWLAGDAGGSGIDVACGEPLVWSTPIEGEGRNAEVRDPLGNLLPAVLQFRGGRRAWVTDATRWQGHYHLLVDGAETEIAAVHVPFGESDLTATPEAAAWPGAVVHPDPGETLGDALMRLRHGREISPFVLMAALLLLIAETLVAREGKSKRAGRPAREAA